MERYLPLEAWIWLFPIVFMLHDLEEIISVEKWVAAHHRLIRKKFPPGLAERMLRQFSMSTAQFAAAVTVMFLFVAYAAYSGYQALTGGLLGSMYVFVTGTLFFFCTCSYISGSGSFFG